MIRRPRDRTPREHLRVGMRRNGRAIGVGIALLVGLWLLPDLAPPPVETPPVELVRGRIVELLENLDDPTRPDVRVVVLDGPLAGEELEGYLQGPSGQQELPRYRAGEEVVVSLSREPEATFIAVSDRWRIPALAGLVALFGLAVVAVGGWRGIRSLISLVLTLGVVVKIVIPLLLAGWDPVPLAVIAATAVTILTFLLTEGLRRATFAATIGTFGALALTAGLAVLFTAIADFTELQGQEEVVFLQTFLGADLDVAGLLLAAVIFGALGVLDDVTITQAATVAELHSADPGAGRSELVWRSMNVGRSHIAATVNTLVLAYVGASLPLLVLFAVGRQDPLLVASGETVAVEVVRSLVGSIGIVAAVPLTTFVAAAFTRPGSRPDRAPDVRRAPGW